jgi:glycoside/pentoside/hexuronide:cation symporter, GPH family
VVLSLYKETIILDLKTKLEKARMHSFELMAHLGEKAGVAKKNREHYSTLLQNITGIDKRLAGMDTGAGTNHLDAELGGIEAEIVLLTRQTPYTLLMMRVVEIGLPLLLSIFSIWFVLRYSLTEKRSHEIKELLKLRGLENSKEAS